MEASHILANQEAEISGLNQKRVGRTDSLPLVTCFPQPVITTFQTENSPSPPNINLWETL